MEVGALLAIRPMYKEKTVSRIVVKSSTGIAFSSNSTSSSKILFCNNLVGIFRNADTNSWKVSLERVAIFVRPAVTGSGKFRVAIDAPKPRSQWLHYAPGGFLYGTLIIDRSPVQAILSTKSMT